MLDELLKEMLESGDIQRLTAADMVQTIRSGQQDPDVQHLLGCCRELLGATQEIIDVLEAQLASRTYTVVLRHKQHDVPGCLYVTTHTGLSVRDVVAKTRLEAAVDWEARLEDVYPQLVFAGDVRLAACLQEKESGELVLELLEPGSQESQPLVNF